MSSKHFTLVTYFIGLCLLTLVDAALYVVTPFSGSSCRGGQPCTVTWLDNGQTPLLSAIGVTHVALYTGTLKLVQTLPPVDVSSTLSLTFTPDPAAGPNSDAYYLSFTSTQAKVNGTEYRAYSPWFRLEGMTGSFDRPLPSATASIPVPSSLTTKASSTVLSTITVGRLSTEIPSPSISLPSPSPSSSPSPSPSASSSTSTSSSPSTSSTSSASPSPSTSSSPSTSRLVTSTINSSSTQATAAAASTAPPPMNNGATGRSSQLSRISLSVIAMILGGALAL